MNNNNVPYNVVKFYNSDELNLGYSADNVLDLEL